MSNRRKTIDNLTEEIEKLVISTNNIRTAIRDLELTESSRTAPIRDTRISYPGHKLVGAVYREGNIIHIGDRVLFLTKGKLKSKEGTVTRFSRNFERVFATDTSGNEIPRDTHNLRILQDGHQHRHA